MTTIKQRRGTAAQWTSANPVLAAGEPGFETDTGNHKIGDGTTAWNSLKATNSATYAPHGEASQTVPHALPRLSAAVRQYDDNAGGTLRTVGLGSSVGLGPTGTLDAVNAVVVKLHGVLAGYFNRLGNMTWADTNASVAGSTITSGQQTDYAAAKTTAGGVPNVVALVYGMNDGEAPQYHGNETYPGVYTNGKALIQAIQGDGADVVIFTTPHPNSALNTYGMGGVTVLYPGGVQKPDSTTGQSLVTVASPSGVNVTAGYRHLRVNQALRQLATDTGCVLIDVEPYWFDAVAAYGEAALFDSGEYVHPNLFAFQQTFHKAIADFQRALVRPSVVAAPAPPVAQVQVAKVNTTTRTATVALAADPELTVNLPANTTWRIEARVYYTTPTTADIRFGFTVPTGAAGRFSVTAPGTAATALEDVMVSRSGDVTGGNWIPAGGNGADATALVTAVIAMGATPGTVPLVWCQNTSDAGNTSVYNHSAMVATQVA